MTVPQSHYAARAQGPSCFTKIKMGFVMGAVVGAGAGIILGGISGLAIRVAEGEMVDDIAGIELKKNHLTHQKRFGT
uniref:Reactive oxygen species modulator 1 n=1 Tax=Romanomermis culicivorax TaxID=13658 RepID=A0A915IN41_ROMCU